MKYHNYNCFCVYMHCNPETGEVFYIGKGCPARAYTVFPRRAEHQKFLMSLLEKGHSIWDIVKIYKKDLSNGNALLIEKELIVKNREGENQLFNIIHAKEPQPPPEKKERPKRYKRHRKYKNRCWN